MRKITLKNLKKKPKYYIKKWAIILLALIIITDIILIIYTDINYITIILVSLFPTILIIFFGYKPPYPKKFNAEIDKNPYTWW